MAAVKMPSFFGGGLLTDGDIKTDKDLSVGGKLIFSSESTLSVPASTKASGTQYEVRFNPTTSNLELWNNNAWIIPFTSAVFYDQTTDSFKARDSASELHTLVTVDSDNIFKDADRVAVAAGDKASPSVYFKGFTNSGMYVDDANGWLGLGVSGAEIVVVKPSGITVRKSDAQNDFLLDVSAVGSTLKTNLDIQGDLTLSGQFDLGGTVVSAANITAYSDIRIKEILGDFKGGLDLIKQFEVKTYNNKVTGDTEIGLIADQILEVYPDAVHIKDNMEMENFKSLKVYQILTLLISAVQELAEGR